MVNEAAHCLGEGILRTARDGDIGASSASAGLPSAAALRYADSLGAAQVVDRLRRYQDRFGARFAPAPN